MSTPSLPPIGPKDKFSPELRIIVASILSMVVIIGYLKFFGPKPSDRPAQNSQAVQTAPATPGSATPGSVAQPDATAPAASQGVTPSTVAAAPLNSPVVGDSQERTIVVENALYRVEFSNRGAVVKSWQLKAYKDDAKPPRTLDLVHNDAALYNNSWPFSLVMDDPQLEKAANTGLFKASSDGSIQSPADLTFTWSDGHLQITKKFHFDNSYVLTVETTSLYNGSRIHSGVSWRGGFGDSTVLNPAPITTVNVFYDENGKLTSLGYKKLDTPEKWGNVWQGGKSFTGIEDRYFAVVFLPPTETLNTPLETRYWRTFHPVKVDNKEEAEAVPEVAASTAAQPVRMRVFVGPKDYDLLKKMHPPLQSLVNFGWLEFIADPLFHGLKWIYKYVPNWGWAIVILTLLINMVLFPLRISSYKSTLKMQRVAPEIKQIQDRYKKYKMNDPRKAEMNKEVMAVYSREGINPVGGCIPQLLQMPIWFGLYRALQGTIELRHAHWFGWITDLSAKDPYYILPLLMGLSMYGASRMTPVTITDPQQAQMMKIMPVFMAGMFLIIPYPSGLAVYILTSSLVGVLQQWYLNRTHPLPAQAKPVRAPKK